MVSKSVVAELELQAVGEDWPKTSEFSSHMQQWFRPDAFFPAPSCSHYYS